MDYGFDWTRYVALSKARGCVLMNVAGMTQCFDVLQEVATLHEALFGEGLVLHLHGSHPGLLVRSNRNVFVVPARSIYNFIVAVIENTLIQFDHRADNY